MTIQDAIETLQESLLPFNSDGTYSRYKMQLDILADQIIAAEKDQYYRNHPEEACGFK